MWVCRWQGLPRLLRANVPFLSRIQPGLLQHLRSSRCLVEAVPFPQALPLLPPGHLLFLLLFPTSSNSLFLPLLHFLLHLLVSTAVLPTQVSAYLYPKKSLNTEEGNTSFCEVLFQLLSLLPEAWPLLSSRKSYRKKVLLLSTFIISKSCIHTVQCHFTSQGLSQQHSFFSVSS